MTGQQLPGNANAERSVLGCILFDDKMMIPLMDADLDGWKETSADSRISG